MCFEFNSSKEMFHVIIKGLVRCGAEVQALVQEFKLVICEFDV